jgi:hypothetical protein
MLKTVTFQTPPGDALVNITALVQEAVRETGITSGLCAIIVPHTTGKTLAAALTAASMDLVGLAITGARGVPLPAASVLVWTYLPNYVCALLAAIMKGSDASGAAIN